MSSPAVKSVVLIVMLALLGTYLYLNRLKLYWSETQYSDILSGEPARDIRFLVRGQELAACNVPLTDSFDADGRRQLGFCRLRNKQFLRLKSESRHVAILVNGSGVPERLYNYDNYLLLDLPTERLYLIRKTDFTTVAGAMAKERSQRRDVIACEGKELCRTIRITGVTGWGALEGPYTKTELLKTRAGLPKGRWGYGPKTELTIRSQKRQKAMLVVYMDQIFPEQQIGFEGAVLATRSLRPEGSAFSYRGGRLYPGAYLLELVLEQGENKIAIHYARWNQPSRSESRPIAAYLTGIEFKELI